MTALAASTAPLFAADSHLADVPVAPGITLRVRTLGRGAPMLLLHGHPQTHAIWHRVAPALAERWTLVLPDMRGYGDSTAPSPQPDHAQQSKRTMAADLVALMRSLGHERFDVVAHDRGARVAHRLAVDHPQAATRMTLLDIAPTLAMYEATGEAFARAYWHWFFLIQPAPWPESVIARDVEGYLAQTMFLRRGRDGFDPRALAEYARCLARPGAAAALCEDYRAAASIDLEHDRADRDAGRRVGTPLQVLWGRRGIIERCFDALAEWRRVADDVRGEALDCGHYVPEEAPDALVERIVAFHAR